MSLVIGEQRGPQWDNAEQRSAGWVKARQGCLTASRMADAMAFLKKGGEGEKRYQLKVDILCERLTGYSVDHYTTKEMQWGIDQEPFARQHYEQVTGRKVTECGFALHPKIEFFGASPDGLLPDGKGLIEIKCPTSRTHLTWYLAGGVPECHRPQMLAQLACTRREYVDFISFDPRFPDPQKALIVRFSPSKEEVEAAEEAARLFLSEVEEMWDRLTMEV